MLIVNNSFEQLVNSIQMKFDIDWKRIGKTPYGKLNKKKRIKENKRIRFSHD